MGICLRIAGFFLKSIVIIDFDILVLDTAAYIFLCYYKMESRYETDIPVIEDDIDQQGIPSDLVYNELLPQMKLDDLVRFCISNNKYKQICQGEDFKKKYEQKHFTITYDLMIRLSENSKEFLRWVRNYFKWYAFLNKINMNACFILPERGKYFINNKGDGIIGCFLDDDIYNNIEQRSINIPFSLRKKIKKYVESEKGINFSDNIELPTTYDILTILLADGKTLSKSGETKDNIQLLLDEKIMVYRRPTIEYGLLDFIIHNQLHESIQFCFLMGMFKHEFGRLFNTIYFGDISVLSNGFKLDSILQVNNNRPTLRYPETFDEFREMFMEYYSYIKTNHVLDDYFPKKEFVMYIYNIFEDQLELYGYLISSDQSGNRYYEFFETDLFNSYIDNNKSQIDNVYTMMIEENDIPIYTESRGSYLDTLFGWLSRLNTNTLKQAYVNIITNITGKDPYKLCCNKIEYQDVELREDPEYGFASLYEIDSFMSSLLSMLRKIGYTPATQLEREFIQMCTIMLLLCGYSVLIPLE